MTAVSAESIEQCIRSVDSRIGDLEETARVWNRTPGIGIITSPIRALGGVVEATAGGVCLYRLSFRAGFWRGSQG